MLSESLINELRESKKLDTMYQGSFNALIDKVLKYGNINMRDYDEWSLLHFSAYCNLKKLAELLLENGIDIDGQTTLGHTPLIKAISRINNDLAELLISYGADINIKDKHDETALDWAKSVENIRMVELLEQLKCNVNSDNELCEEVKRMLKM